MECQTSTPLQGKVIHLKSGEKFKDVVVIGMCTGKQTKLYEFQILDYDPSGVYQLGW